jgi:LysR family nitrogen assimilation transcriptional regulator
LAWLLRQVAEPEHLAMGQIFSTCLQEADDSWSPHQNVITGAADLPDLQGSGMDLRQLRTFRSVAELGSLSKASDRLRVAQPALSRQIKLLEHELRVELFTRNGRGMVLTSAGQLLLDRTTGLVRQIEQVRDDLQSAGGRPSGRVVLGLVPTVSCVLSARFGRRVIETLPDLKRR